MAVQPHLLLLQKTMVMVEGVALSLDPQVNMWDVAEPYVREWIRDELGPEAALADGIREQGKTLALIPDIIRRLDAQLPRKGGAPPAPPLPEIALMWDKGERKRWWRYALTAIAGAAAGVGAMGWFAGNIHF